MAYEDFLKQLHGQPWFKEFVKHEVIAGIPSLPSFNPGNPDVERWKYDSGVREGYRQCLTKFGVNPDE